MTIDIMKDGENHPSRGIFWVVYIPHIAHDDDDDDDDDDDEDDDDDDDDDGLSDCCVELTSEVRCLNVVAVSLIYIYFVQLVQGDDMLV